MFSLIKKKSLTVLVPAMIAAVCLALAGCASPMAIGEKADGSSELKLTNGLERGVTSISLCASGSDGYGSPLAQEGELESKATAVLYFAANGPADIKVQTTGGTTYELHEVNLADMKDATLMSEGDIAYLEYTPAAGGSVVSTLDAEKAYRQAVKEAEEAAKKAEEERLAAEAAQKAAEEEAARKAEEEAAAKKAAEEEAARKAEEEAAAKKAAEEEEARKAEERARQQKSSSGNSGNSSSGGNSGGGNSSGGNSGGEDACADDLLFN